jgi:hypothetical protein
MQKKALQLAARFSLPPNSLGYCGKDTAPSKFIDCVVNGNCKGVEEEFTKFIVLNPYLETLSEITNLPKFSYEVIEAYWLGNYELKKAKIDHYNLLLENFIEQGVPDFFIKELSKKIPKEFIPFHLFQVLHVGVGRASGSVPYNIETINNCMIRWGRVIKVLKKSLYVELNSLKQVANSYQLTVIKEKHDYNANFLEGLKEGNTVAVHWKQVVNILTKKEIKNIDYWTRKVLTTLNS